MKHFPKIHFKEIMVLALVACLIVLVLFIGQKASSEGPSGGQTQGYFYCLADPACTKNFNCPTGRDCSCLDQYIAKVRYIKICKSQPEGEVSGTCENCGTFGETPEDDKNCALYGNSGTWVGWCGCKITCATPTPTPTPCCGKECPNGGDWCENKDGKEWQVRCILRSDDSCTIVRKECSYGCIYGDVCQGYCKPAPTPPPAGSQGGGNTGTGDEPGAPSYYLP